MPTEPLWNALANSGQRLFGWSPPTGLPDDGAYFLGANSMRQRWQLVLAVAENAWGTGTLPTLPWPAAAATPHAVANHMTAALYGDAKGPVVAGVLAGLGWPADQALGDPHRPEVMQRVARIAALAAMAPEFQTA
jgi:hypothetical protein